MEVTPDITFDVVGVPAPQGSKSAFVRGGRAVVVDGTSKIGRQKHLAWRDLVTFQALEVARTHAQFTGPIGVTIKFFMPIPASDAHRTHHWTKPDLDKLVRSVFDSLTASALIRDDSQVCTLGAVKSYARDGHWTGATVSIFDLTTVENLNRIRSKEKAKRAKKA